jgi:phosphoribosyl-AMP cyclohydrolase
MEQMLDQVKFNDKGLVGAVVQDVGTKEVLMFAWMNRESLELTLKEKRAWYWSRSRNKLWLKGETSGHVQKVHEVRLDCDADAVLLVVEQTGGACHTGYMSCFYRLAENNSWIERGEKAFSAETVYKK